MASIVPSERSLHEALTKTSQMKQVLSKDLFENKQNHKNEF